MCFFWRGGGGERERYIISNRAIFSNFHNIEILCSSRKKGVCKYSQGPE